MKKIKLNSELTDLKSPLFVTGTDTGVGKSIITAFLALSFLEQGKKVAISKPLQTGHPRDTNFLSTLIENKIPIFNTYALELPAAPSVASEHENKKIDVSKIVFDIKKLEKEYDIVIVEGIGGIAVPITFHNRAELLGVRNEWNRFNSQSSMLNPQSYLVADLIKDLGYPTIIVARPSLGTINHTVLTIDFAKHRGIDLLGFVTSGYDEKIDDPVVETAPDVISKITQINCLFKFPMLSEVNSKAIYKIIGDCVIPIC